MDLNKILSLAVGLIVFILIFVFIARQFSGTKSSTNTAVLSATPTIKITPTPTKSAQKVQSDFDIASWFTNFGKSNQPTTPPVKKSVNPSGTITKIRVYEIQKQYPTLTPTPTKTNTAATTKNTNNQTNETTQNTTSGQQTYQIRAEQAHEIPQTGLPTEVIPLLMSGLFGGLYLRKKSS